MCSQRTVNSSVSNNIWLFIELNSEEGDTAFRNAAHLTADIVLLLKNYQIKLLKRLNYLNAGAFNPRASFLPVWRSIFTRGTVYKS